MYHTELFIDRDDRIRAILGVQREALVGEVNNSNRRRDWDTVSGLINLNTWKHDTSVDSTVGFCGK
jgi:hypothetical protein